VKQEKTPLLADSPFYTKRFAFYIGKRCESSTIKDIAKEFHLDRNMSILLRHLFAEFSVERPHFRQLSSVC
jgi:hypothetical protein